MVNIQEQCQIDTSTHTLFPQRNQELNPCTFDVYFLLCTGTVTPTACPRGTILNNTGGESIDDCYACLPGQYCNAVGAFEPTGDCEARYYCPESAEIKVSQPTDFLCPAGFFCPERTADPVACAPGKE